ncbi:hypothetical protein ACGFY9_39885 [Streptomyces sp. NPDC048504]|uniref:hypothetical protein n=1 Tax=Streptomyces sp. NPDC048504 TaxID=3365559 RepID=UPI003717A73F
MSARFKVVDNHVVDTWGGVIVAELDKPRKRGRSGKRLSMTVRRQIDANIAAAAGVVLGCWLPFAHWPL